MGNFSSYVKLPSGNNKGKLCIVYQEKIYIDFVHDDYAIVTKYDLPDRDIGFHILDNLLYVYSTTMKGNSRIELKTKKEIILPKKIYDKIVEIYKLMELKKIKSVFIVDELKKLNNYNTFTVNV